MDERRAIRSAVVVAVLATASPALAQNVPAVQIAYERSRDRFHYRFENPSSFDTADPVPHHFVQTYWADNQWLAVKAAFRLGARAFASEVAATPHRTTRGDDFDTFFQPSGDVVVSGTTGNVSLRAWRFRQTVSLGRAAGVTWHVGYRYRRDRSIFHPGLKIVTHTLPPSREAFVVSTRETTISNVHEVLFGVSRDWRPGTKWCVAFGMDVSPTTNARLTTLLPDKYPGREILFSAVVMSVTPTLAVTSRSRWPVSLSLGATRTFSYADSRQFDRNMMTAAVGVGIPR